MEATVSRAFSSGPRDVTSSHIQTNQYYLCTGLIIVSVESSAVRILLTLETPSFINSKSDGSARATREKRDLSSCHRSSSLFTADTVTNEAEGQRNALILVDVRSDKSDLEGLGNIGHGTSSKVMGFGSPFKMSFHCPS